MVLAAALLTFILCLLSHRFQKSVGRWIQNPVGVFLAAAALSALFCAAAAWYDALSWKLGGIIFSYTFVPVLCVVSGNGDQSRARNADLAAILALWLPLEFAVGATLVPRPVQGILHAIAYGVAVSLALIVFLIYRRFEGMKYNPPRNLSDSQNALAGFLCAAAILIPLGLAVGFLGPSHWPTMSVGTAVIRVALIFAGTALPEEILFRALIQNWLVQRFGGSNWTIALAALVFGLSHLNNASDPFNWRYAVVATVAGFIFGKVFQRSTSILASAFVHTGVNTVKHFFF